jgi:hypothetical protein
MTRTYLSLQVAKNVALPDRSPSLKGVRYELGTVQMGLIGSVEILFFRHILV